MRRPYIVLYNRCPARRGDFTVVMGDSPDLSKWGNGIDNRGGPVADTEDGLYRWLPEVQTIRGKVGNEVESVFVNGAPNYFWYVRASRTHHPPDHRGTHGLILHTKRAFHAYTVLEGTYRAHSLMDQFEANCGRAAILLHDLFKFGDPNEADPELDEHDYCDHPSLTGIPSGATSDHDIVCAEWVRSETDLPEEVAGCIETHNGQYYDGPSPRSQLELCIHQADMIASNEAMARGIYDAPQEMIDDFDPMIVGGEDWVTDLRNGL